MSFVMVGRIEALWNFGPAEAVVERFLKLRNTRALLTIHDTDLLDNDLLRSDYYFVLQGEKIKSLYRFTDVHIREGRNPQKMLKAGFFDE